MLSTADAKRALDIISTIIVTGAAVLVLWTFVQGRSPLQATGPTRAVVEDVKGLGIDSTKVVNSQGTGTIALVEFTDYQCPYCARHAKDTAPLIRRELVEPGTLRYIVLDYPFERAHPQARRAAEAAECAGQQGRFWEMHDRLFTEPATLASGDMSKFADSLNLNRGRFDKCMSGETTNKVTADIAEGRRLKVDSTPVFFLGELQKNGSIELRKRINGAQPYAEFKHAVAQLVKAHSAEKSWWKSLGLTSVLLR